MSEKRVFIDRRRGNDRRNDPDPCAEMPMDLFHRKRRKSTERRAPNRTLAEDYYAFMNAGSEGVANEASSLPTQNAEDESSTTKKTN